jgi:hypothetical protein
LIYFNNTGEYAVVTYGKAEKTKSDIFCLIQGPNFLKSKSFNHGFTKSGNLVTFTTHKNPFMVAQKAISKVDIFSLDSKSLFAPVNEMTIIPSMKIGCITDSDLPLFYGINTNGSKDGLNGCYLELYDAAQGNVFTSLFYEHD